MRSGKVRACIVACAGVLLVVGCGMHATKTETRREFFAMDTIMALTVYGDESERAADAAVQEIERLDDLLSTGRKDSEISRLNAAGEGKVSKEVSYLMERSRELAIDTDGAFDVTIYPIMEAWGFAGGDFRVPGVQELESLLAHVDASDIVIDSKQGKVKLPEDAKVDLGGIAKGYASVKALELLRQMGVQSAMLNLGGYVALLGEKKDGTEWRIAIRDPEKQEDYLGVIEARDRYIITSGGYERFFEENGMTYHHIIDPGTGKPANNGLSSVTIVSDDGTLADGLSTALFVMGTKKAVSYWKNHCDAFEAILLAEDGTLYITEGLEGHFSSGRKYQVIYHE